MPDRAAFTTTSITALLLCLDKNPAAVRPRQVCGDRVRGNVHLVGGTTWYIVATRWVPAMAFGVFPIVPSTVLAVVLYVAAAYVGPPPSRTLLVKFWGTQAEIDKLAAPRRPVGPR